MNMSPPIQDKGFERATETLCVCGFVCLWFLLSLDFLSNFVNSSPYVILESYLIKKAEECSQFTWLGLRCFATGHPQGEVEDE